MEYKLKDKIQITKDFLSDLEMRSWQEIEHLQNQIANIEITPETTEVVKLLKNLLTSYYVFAGGLENLTDTTPVYKIPELTDEVCVEKELTAVNPVKPEIKTEPCIEDDFFEPLVQEDNDLPVSEPFEYFVDFDDPIGEPLSDEDLYNN